MYSLIRRKGKHGERSNPSTDGVEACRVLHHWYTKVSNPGLQERRSKVMIPEKAPNEAAMVLCIERWERHIRELKDIVREDPLSDAMMRDFSASCADPWKTLSRKRNSRATGK